MVTPETSLFRLEGTIGKEVAKNLASTCIYRRVTKSKATYIWSQSDQYTEIPNSV